MTRWLSALTVAGLVAATAAAGVASATLRWWETVLDVDYGDGDDA